jgi:dTDP-4-dehydrorhamnose reductase
MKILVFGANGQIGQEFRTLALDSPFQMVFFGRNDLDLTNGNRLLDVLVTNSPDLIINCAAYTAVDQAEANSKDAYSINAAAIELLAKGCADNDIVLIHLSTDYVFDGSGDVPFRESDQVAPVSVYGKTKLAGEIAIKNQLERHIILRTSWVFGEFGDNFVKTMLRIGANKQELEIVSDQWGSPTSAKGIAECCIQICTKINLKKENINWGTYHFSGSPYISWYGFADAIFKKAFELGLINKKPRLVSVTSSAFPTIAVRPANSRLNCDKIYSHFDIRPDDWAKKLSFVLKKLD